MAARHFDDLLREAGVQSRIGGNPPVTEVVYDSRLAAAGSLFVAMHGGTTDGNRYIDSALLQGAAAVVTDSRVTLDRLHTTYPHLAAALVGHGRKALAAVSANFFDHPERKLNISGVTGTNGKTTTAFLLESLLSSAGRACVLVGTIEYHVGGKVLASPHTTPESRDLFEMFAAGVATSAAEAVMEVSSHALDQARVWGLHFDTAIFTNLTQDHLDYHGDMESYFQAKTKLFTGAGAAPPRVAVINAADIYGQRLIPIARSAGCEIIQYAASGDFRAEDTQFAHSGTRFRIITPQGPADIRTRLTGPVNVLNILAAAAAASARGLTLEQIVRGVDRIDCVPGRFQTIDCGQPFTVAVDYAHTDDALRNLTQMARQLASSRQGRVITLFGCGGDRDRTKRPRMGHAAGEGSDFVVLTSDNPRSEDPDAILAAIVPGVKSTGTRYTVEPDRAKAIRLALHEARANDVVLIAGKGHEKVQVLRDRTIPFDDAEEAARALHELFPRGAQGEAE